MDNIEKYETFKSKKDLKKEWCKPDIIKMGIKNTKLGVFVSPTETIDTLFLGGRS